MNRKNLVAIGFNNIGITHAKLGNFSENKK